MAEVLVYLVHSSGVGPSRSHFTLVLSLSAHFHVFGDAWCILSQFLWYVVSIEYTWASAEVPLIKSHWLPIFSSPIGSPSLFEDDMDIQIDVNVFFVLMLLIVMVAPHWAIQGKGLAAIWQLDDTWVHLRCLNWSRAGIIVLTSVRRNGISREAAQNSACHPWLCCGYVTRVCRAWS